MAKINKFLSKWCGVLREFLFFRAGFRRRCVFLFFFVGVDDVFYQAVADDVCAVEFYEGDAFDFAEYFEGLFESGVGVVRQVYLAHVAGYDEFGTDTHPGEEHF